MLVRVHNVGLWYKWESGEVKGCWRLKTKEESERVDVYHRRAREWSGKVGGRGGKDSFSQTVGSQSRASSKMRLFLLHRRLPAKLMAPPGCMHGGQSQRGGLASLCASGSSRIQGGSTLP